MTDGGDNQYDPMTAAARLREHAVRARRLARGYLSEANRRMLNEMADQLEAEAATLEQAAASAALQAAN